MANVIGGELNMDLSGVLADAQKLDATILQMVKHSQQLGQTLNTALSGLSKDSSATSILERLSQSMERLSTRKVSPNFDVTKANELYSIMDNIVKMVQGMASVKLELFDTKGVYATQKSLFGLEAEVSKIDKAISKARKKWSGAGATVTKRMGISDKRTKEYKDAVRNIQLKAEAEMKSLIEKKAIADKELQYAKMTQDQKAQYVKQKLDAMLAEEKRYATQVQAEYKRITTEMVSLMKQTDTLSKKNQSGAISPQIQGLESRFIELNQRRVALEQQYGNTVVDIAKRVNTQVLAIEANRIAEKKKAEENALNAQREKYLSSPKGALQLANDAKTIEQMKEAQKYLQTARDQTNVADTKTIEALNQAYQRLRITIESLTTAENNEQTLQPSIRNEYARLLTEIDKIADAKKRLQDTTAYKRGDAEAVKAYQDLVAYEKDLSKKRVDIEKEAQGKLDDIQRMHAAKRAQQTLKKAEDQMKAEKRVSDAKAKEEKAAYNRNIKAYNSAMGMGEATINQRINKLVRLRQIEEQLSQSSARYANELAKVRDAMQRLSKEEAAFNSQRSAHHKALQGTIGQLQRQFLALYSVSAIKGYVNKLVQVRGEFEMQRTALASLLASKDEANELWDKTLQLAVRSPFTIKELITYTKQLAAYRVESSKLYETNKMLADVSAGLGVDMQRLILAYGQVKAATYLRGTELRQFTEAGVNMLKELADIYSETEGRMVSTGDVFERISKRMVVFEDVEEVFKRLTSEGGLFYQMQEKQSQTLRGQIMNLKDSIDIMLNDIAQQNDWVISKMLSLIKTAITNWRALLVAIEGVATLMITMGITKFVIGWQMVAKVGAEAALAMNGVVGAGARAKVAIQALWGMLANHPIIAVIAGVVALGATIYQLWDAHDSMVEKYDELSRAEVERINNLSRMNDKIQENNKRIRSSSDALKKAKAGTMEYSKAKKANSVAINDNINALNELKSKYPELADVIKVAEDGTIDLTQAMEHQRLKAQLMIVLNDAMKADTFFTEDFKADLADTLQAQTKVTKSLGNLQVAAKMSGEELLKAFQQGKIDETQYKTLEKLLGRISAAQNYDEAKKAIEELIEGTKQWGNSYAGTINNIKDGTISAWGDLKSAQDNYFDEWGENAQVIEEVSDMWAQTIQKMFNIQKDEGKKAAGEFVDSVLESIGIADKEMKQWGREIIEKKLKIELIYTDEGEAELEGWQKDVADAMTNQVNLKLDELQETLNDARATPLKRLTLGNVMLPTMNQDRKAYQEYIKGLIDENKKIIETSKIENQKIYDEAEIAAAKANEPMLKLAGKIVGIDEDTKDKKTTNSIWEQRISLLKELRKEYVDLSKTFNETTSRQKVMNGYMEAANELFKDLGIDISQIPFDDLERMSAFVSELMKQVKEGSKDEIKLGKLKGFFDVDIETKDTKDYQEQLIKQMQNLFDNYELGKELEKLHLPKELMKQLFDVDVLNLDELRDRITSMDISNFGEDALKEYDKLLDKIREMELKEQEERMKMYSKYLIKAQNERIKAKIDEMKQIEEINKTFVMADDAIINMGIDATQLENIRESLATQNLTLEQAIENWVIYRDTLQTLGVTDVQIQKLYEYLLALREASKLATSGVQKETQEKLDKEAWESFKASTMYEQLFSDLENLGNKSIEMLITKLGDLKDNLKNLPPNIYKEIQGQISKLEEIQMKRDPFGAYYESWKKIRDLQKEGVTLEDIDASGNTTERKVGGTEDELTAALVHEETKIESLKEQQVLYSQIKQAQGDENKLKAVGITLTEGQRKLLGNTQGEYDQLILGAKEQEEQARKNAESLGMSLETYKKMRAANEKAIAHAKAWGEALTGVLDGIDAILDAFGLAEDSTARLWIKNAKQIADMVVQVVILTVSLQAMGVAANMALGVIGWIATALQAVALLFSSIFAAHDNALEKQIQELQDKVELLEKSFDKLKKAIDRAYSSTALDDHLDDALVNTQKQIQSYYEMIELEEAKKDRDSEKIEEYRDKIDELREAYQDLKEEVVESLGGSYDIRGTTREFVDAWLEAFRETGSGLDGLKDNFKEFFQNVLLEQAVMKGGATIMEGLLTEINNSLADDFKIDSAEYDVIKQKGEITMEQLNEFLNGLLGEGGLFNEFMTDAGDNLSGLQKGIQGITEAQADILAAYLNSLRFYVADSNTKLTQLVDMQTNDSIPNPMLAELKAQTELIRGIRDMFSSVIRSGHPTYGGAFLKVAL